LTQWDFLIIIDNRLGLGEVMESVAKELNGIKITLEKHNEIVQNILMVIKKPENKFIRILQIIGLGAGALAIFNIIENIIKWILSGG